MKNITKLLFTLPLIYITSCTSTGSSAALNKSYSYTSGNITFTYNNGVTSETFFSKDEGYMFSDIDGYKDEGELETTIANNLKGTNKNEEAYSSSYLNLTNNLGATNMTYEGKNTTLYYVNYMKVSEYEITSRCYYASIDTNSYRLLEINTSNEELEGYKISINRITSVGSSVLAITNKNFTIDGDNLIANFDLLLTNTNTTKSGSITMTWNLVK